MQEFLPKLVLSSNFEIKKARDNCMTCGILFCSRGQGHPTANSLPYFGPSRKLDFELEMVSLFSFFFPLFLCPKVK